MNEQSGARTANRQELLRGYLGRLLLQKLDFSVLQKGEKPGDDVLQERGILRGRCHILVREKKGRRHRTDVTQIILIYIQSHY